MKASEYAPHLALMYSKAQWRLERLASVLEIIARYETLNELLAAELKEARAALETLKSDELQLWKASPSTELAVIDGGSDGPEAA